MSTDRNSQVRANKPSWLRSILVTVRPLRLHLLILAIVWGATQTSQFADTFEADTSHWIIPTTAFYIIFLGTAFRITAISESIHVQSFCTIILVGTAFFILLLGFTPDLIPTLTVIPDDFSDGMVKDWSSRMARPDRMSSNLWFGMFGLYVVSLGMIGRSTGLRHYLRPSTLKALLRFAVISLFGLTVYDSYLLYHHPHTAAFLNFARSIAFAFLLVLVDICSPSNITYRRWPEAWEALPQAKAWSVWLTPFHQLARLTSRPISSSLSVTMLIIVPILMLVLFAVSGAASRVSVPSLVILEALIWLLIVTELQSWSKRLDLPIITLLVLWGIFLSVLGWNYRHKVRLIDGLPPTRTDKVENIFADCIDKRKDLPPDPKQPYPVVLVAAEGGGIRAAYLTALLLSVFNARFPQLMHHLFAVSAVSGGAVGAAYFAANDKATLEGKAADAKVDEFFLNDYLSGPLADLLGAELLQRILPTQLPVLTHNLKILRGIGIDRAAAAEIGFENAFKKMTGSSAFETDFCTGYDSGRDSPLMLLNATDAYTGQRVVLTPSRLSNDTNAVYPVQENPSLHIRLSTAAMLGARFPLISPAGELTLDSHRRLELLDGGYVDNTGTETLGALIRELVNAIHSGWLKRRVSLIVLTLKYYGDPSQSHKIPTGSFEILPVIAALLNSRDKLATSSEKIALIMQALGPDIPYACVEIPLISAFRKQPLGWKLSLDAQWDLLMQLQSAASRMDPGLRKSALWPPEPVNLREAYAQSLQSSIDMIEWKSPAIDRPDYGRPLLAFTQASSIPPSDLPRFMPWCDAVIRANGELFSDVSKDIVDAVNAIRSARNFVMDFSAIPNEDTALQKLMGHLAQHKIPGYLSYAKYVHVMTVKGTPTSPASEPGAGRLRPYSERCQVRWTRAFHRYNDALLILSTIKTEDSLKTQALVQSELEELTKMYKERWPEVDPFTAKADD